MSETPTPDPNGGDNGDDGQENGGGEQGGVLACETDPGALGDGAVHGPAVVDKPLGPEVAELGPHPFEELSAVLGQDIVVVGSGRIRP